MHCIRASRRNPMIVTEPSMPTESANAHRADGLPARSTPAPASERPPLDVARRVVELAEDKKAADIVLLDLSGLTTMADYFVICSGGSERQLARHRRWHPRWAARRADEADRQGGDRRIALDTARFRCRRRPYLHAARARLLRPREALVRGENRHPGPVTPAFDAPQYRESAAGWRAGVLAGHADDTGSLLAVPA